MKHKKIKILIIILVIVLAIVIVPILRKRIWIYQVKDKFLGTIYDIKRNGNYHTVYFYKMKDNDNILASDARIEIYAKDGESVQINDFDNTDGTTSKTTIIIKDGYEYDILERSDGAVNGIYRPIQWFHKINTNNVIGDLLANVIYNGHFKTMKEGKYKQKDCYIATVEYDDIEAQDTVYIDKETYLPIKIESNPEDGLYEEYEWVTLEVGTVRQLPEYDLKEIEEHAVSALELNEKE